MRVPWNDVENVLKRQFLFSHIQCCVINMQLLTQSMLVIDR